MAGALACTAFECTAAGAAGRGEPARELRNGRPERVQEMRRQLFEHQEHWRGDAVIKQSPSTPGLSGTSSGGDAVDPSRDQLPHATPAVSPASAGDSRLSDRERNLLRQQLRQIPRLQAPGKQ